MRYFFLEKTVSEKETIRDFPSYLAFDGVLSSKPFWLNETGLGGLILIKTSPDKETNREIIDTIHEVVKKTKTRINYSIHYKDADVTKLFALGFTVAAPSELDVKNWTLDATAATFQEILSKVQAILSAKKTPFRALNTAAEVVEYSKRLWLPSPVSSSLKEAGEAATSLKNLHDYLLKNLDIRVDRAFWFTKERCYFPFIGVMSAGDDTMTLEDVTNWVKLSEIKSVSSRVHSLFFSPSNDALFPVECHGLVFITTSTPNTLSEHLGTFLEKNAIFAMEMAARDLLEKECQRIYLFQADGIWPHLYQMLFPGFTDPSVFKVHPILEFPVLKILPRRQE